MTVLNFKIPTAWMAVGKRLSWMEDRCTTVEAREDESRANNEAINVLKIQNAA